MIAHTHLHVSDYARSQAFYIKILATLGYENNMEVGEAAGFFDGKNTDLWVLRESVVPTPPGIRGLEPRKGGGVARGSAGSRRNRQRCAGLSRPLLAGLLRRVCLRSGRPQHRSRLVRLRESGRTCSGNMRPSIAGSAPVWTQRILR